MKLTEQEILNIFKNCKLDELGLENEDMDYGNYDIYLENIHIPEGWTYEVEHGASKLIVILYKRDEEPIVIKIPMSGLWYSVYTDDDERLDDEFEEFSGAISCLNPDNHWDYCNVEEEIYNFAKEEQLEGFFAETRCIGVVNDRPIYLQTFVDRVCDEKGAKKSSKKSYEKAQRLKEEHPFSIDTEWLASAFEWYSDDMIKNLFIFLEEQEVGDLHSGNVGYVGGRPVILDYSDFNY